MLDENRAATERIFKCLCDIIDCLQVHREKNTLLMVPKYFSSTSVSYTNYFTLRSLKDPEKFISTS